MKITQIRSATNRLVYAGKHFSSIRGFDPPPACLQLHRHSRPPLPYSRPDEGAPADAIL